MMNWELSAAKLLTAQTPPQASLCPGLFPPHVEVSFFFWASDSLLSVWGVYCHARCSFNQGARGASIKGTYGLGRWITAPVHEVGQPLGVTGDLVIFTVVSDAPSPSSSLMKDADAFREEVQLELDSTLGTQGGACSRNLQIWRRSLCTEAVLPVNVPRHQISASFFSSEDTSGWGWEEPVGGNKKNRRNSHR